MRDRVELMDGLNEELKEQMEKRKKNLGRYDVPAERSLRNALLTLTKTELDDIRYNLCVSGISSLKKQEMAEVLVPAILTFSHRWFVTIGGEQYNMLSKIRDQHGISTGLSDEDVRIDYMRSMGIIFSGMQDGKLAWYMPDELLEIYTKMDHQKYAKAVALNDEVVRLVTGLLFYYGYLSYEQIYEKIIGLIERKDLEFIDFMGIIINAGCWQQNIVNVETGMHYYTLMNPENVIDEQLMRKELEFCEFTYETLYQAGEMDYIEETDAFKALVGFFMKEFSLSVMDAVEVVGELQIILLNDEKFSEMIDYIQTVVTIPTQDVADRMIGLLTAFNNTTRLWRLKGHRPVDLNTERKQNIAPYTTKKYKDNVVKFVPLSSEVGRNDLCPCGSGKKYKKCCLHKEV